MEAEKLHRPIVLINAPLASGRLILWMNSPQPPAQGLARETAY